VPQKQIDQTSKNFKDLFNKSSASELADQIISTYPKFDKQRFVRFACQEISTLEMKQRVLRFSEALRKTLPPDIPEAFKILIKSLPEAKQDCTSLSDGWLQWPISQFIADYGLPHYELSMHAMTELTMRFTSEFAVRPFAVTYPKEVYHDILQRTTHKNPHVRRWCSEGLRPKLPWGIQLKNLISDPSPILPILDALFDDNELYVRRSVANSLNDIAKNHPTIVIEKCRQWKMRSDSPHLNQLIKHALRTLIKNGHAGALELLGFYPPRQINAELSLSKSNLKIGESIELNLDLTSNCSASQNLNIDFAIHYKRQNKKISAKIFKWKTIRLPANSSTNLIKKHSFKRTTVRALYPGEHQAEILINGSSKANVFFQLKS